MRCVRVQIQVILHAPRSHLHHERATGAVMRPVICASLRIGICPDMHAKFTTLTSHLLFQRLTLTPSVRSITWSLVLISSATASTSSSFPASAWLSSPARLCHGKDREEEDPRSGLPGWRAPGRTCARA
jgi:hypothetical protein